MSSINSTSTLAQVESAYDDNAGYFEDQSTSECLKFITACRILLRRYKKAIADGGTQFTRSVEQMEAELRSATDWYYMATGTSAENMVPQPISAEGGDTVNLLSIPPIAPPGS